MVFRRTLKIFKMQSLGSEIKPEAEGNLRRLRVRLSQQDLREVGHHTAKEAGTPMARPPIPPRLAWLLPFHSSLSEKAEVAGPKASAEQNQADNYCFHQSTHQIVDFHRQLSTKKSRRKPDHCIGQYGLRSEGRLIIPVQVWNLK